MNWDTKETWEWITSEESYWYHLKQWIGNEMLFIYTLVDIIHHINLQQGEGKEIDFKNVNGNEIYVDFCELNGNETDGWK